MEYLNQKDHLSAFEIPVKLTVDMGDWRPDDEKLRKLLSELPYPAFCLYIPKYLRPALEEIIKKSINPTVKYGQPQNTDLPHKNTQ